MRQARTALAGAIAIGGALTRGEKGFPGNSGGITDPGLLRFRVEQAV